MIERESYQRSLFAEALAPYGTESSGAHRKLSISLPVELADLVRESARESGLSVSGVIAASLRRTLGDAEQANIDAALEAQYDENLDWANAYMPIAMEVVKDLEW
jgi:hypothetical protein